MKESNNSQQLKTVKNFFNKDFQIPKHWDYIQYREIVKLVETPVNFNDDESYQLIKAKRGNRGIVLRETLKGKKIKTKKLFSVEPDDFIIGKMQIIHGACGLVPEELKNAKISGSYLRLKSKSTKKLDLKYFNWFSNTKLFNQHVFISSEGTNLEKMNLNLEHWFDHYVPLPQIEEQKKIVNIMSNLEELIKKQDEIIQFYQKLYQYFLNIAFDGTLTKNWRAKNVKIDSAEDLLQSILDDFKKKKIKKTIKKFDPTDLPESWIRINLDLVSELITKGSSPKWQGIKYVQNGTLFVTSENVGIGELLLDKSKFVEDKFNQIAKKSVLKFGDVLTNIVGGSIGRTCIFDLNKKANINQAVSLIRLHEKVDHEYVMHFLNSSTIINFMNVEKGDNARPNISLDNVGNFPLVFPPFDEQIEISKIFSLIKKLIQNENFYQLFLKRMKKGLLQKLTSGKILVPI